MLLCTIPLGPNGRKIVDPLPAPPRPSLLPPSGLQDSIPHTVRLSAYPTVGPLKHALPMPEQSSLPQSLSSLPAHAQHAQVRKFDHPEEDVIKCLLPLHTSELGRLSIPEEEREPDFREDGGAGDTRTQEEVLDEYRRFMDAHGVPAKVGRWAGGWVGG